MTQRKSKAAVLIVNDTPEQLDVMVRHLRNKDYDILTASDGQEGFEIAQNEHLDLIISDVVMPRMDGIELCRLIRERPELRPIPVLLVSAIRKDIESVVKGLRAGANEYLEIPYQPSHLVDMAARLIERKWADETFRESVERFKKYFELGLIGMAISSPDKGCIEVNDKLCEMLGYERSELLQMTWVDITHPDDLKADLANFNRVMSGEADGYSMYKRYIRKNGQVIHATLEVKCLRRADGSVDHFVALVQDITERKRVEQELIESEERYRDLVENARDIIYTHDLEGNYTSVNKAGEQLTGYTREESLKMNLAQTVAPEYHDRARQMIANKLAGEKETIYDLEIIKKDGNRIALEVNTRLITKNGAPIGIQGIARDITEREQLEEQLRQAQKMEAVGRLAGGIAHDFNNMLTAIAGYSELAIMQLQAQDPLRECIEEIKKASDRAASLTRQLLAFSRKQVLQPKVLDLNSVVKEMEKMIRRLIGEDIHLRTMLSPDLGSIKADPGQIEQVVLNLAVNGRDAMPKGGRLIIETSNVYLDNKYAARHIAVKPGPYALLAVSDTGIGINEEEQKHIFEPFFTTKEIGKGTGLGLSTVYGIVKQSGGNIWVYSEVGLGTTFKIYLPRVDEGAEVYKPGVEQEEALQGSETILVAEDEEVVRRLVREVLKSYGYKVLEAGNGGAAFLICERYKEPIQMLLTDVIMPEMGGRELADRLAQLRPGIKVLYMSGYTDDAIVHHGVLDDDVPFIQKPFAPHALAQKVREVLSQPELKGR